MTQEPDTRITITIPASLRKLLKVNAIQNDRSYSGEIVRCLKIGSGWKPDEEAAGEHFGEDAPAAENDKAALAGGSI